MSFTLGNKEAIVNSSKMFKQTVAGTPEILSIKGFANISEDQVLTAKGQRFIAETFGTMELTAPAAADLGIATGAVNVPVVAHIRVNTIRHASEWATDFIKRGRPFIFEILVNGDESAIAIATKLQNAFVEYQLKFNLAASGLPFTWTRTAAKLTLTLKSGSLSFQKYVDFTANNATYGVKAVTAVTAGSEPIADGAYLEENVRMSLPGTTDSYGIAPGENPVISGSYTQITFTAEVDGVGIDGVSAPHKGAEGVGDQVAPKRVVAFTLYYLEESDLFATGGVMDDLVAFLSGNTAIDGFLKANGTAATDVADFIA